MHFLMFYEFTADYLERRGAFARSIYTMRGQRRIAANSY